MNINSHYAIFKKLCSSIYLEWLYQDSLQFSPDKFCARQFKYLNRYNISYSGTFDIPAVDIITLYQASGSGGPSKIYSVPLLTSRSLYSAGIGFKNIDFSFSQLAYGFHLLTHINTLASTYLGVNVMSNKGSSLYQLQLSYIVIDDSIKNMLFI